jgi:peroxiredoxin
MIKKLLPLAFLLFTAALCADELPGLKAGDKAVDFTLKNSAGGEVALTALLMKGPVVLAFVRSADWCPFCRRQLQDLQKDLKAIEATGAQLIAVSYDSPATNSAAAAKLGLTFPLLSDAGSKIIDAYGIRNHDAKGRADGIPHPVVYIIDPRGVIRVKLMREGYRERPESAEIIAGVKSFE